MTRRGGRLPDPGLAALCARASCGEPREAHGGALHLGACPGESGVRAARFQLRDEDKAPAPPPTHPETWTCVVCGATDVHGADRWSRIRAYRAGWYSTRDEEMRFCPAHCPPFAANYQPPTEPHPAMRCHVCGKKGCPSQADPVGGPFALHNAAAYGALLERRSRDA